MPPGAVGVRTATGIVVVLSERARRGCKQKYIPRVNLVAVLKQALKLCLIEQAPVNNYAMSFQVPRKCILSPEQLTVFQSSKTHQKVVTYIETLNNAVIGIKLTEDCSESPVSVWFPSSA